MRQIISTSVTKKKDWTKRLTSIGAIIVGTIFVAAIYYGISRVFVARESTVKDAPVQQPKVIRSSKELAQDLESTNDREQKIKIYHELATSQQLEGDFAGAIKNIQALLEIDPTARNYGRLGALYRLSGSHPAAIEAYKKALSMLPKSTDPDERSDYNTYLEELKMVGGSL